MALSSNTITGKDVGAVTSRYCCQSLLSITSFNIAPPHSETTAAYERVQYLTQTVTIWSTVHSPILLCLLDSGRTLDLLHVL